MAVVNTIVGKMLEPIRDRLFTSTGRQIGYLVHYKKNIKNFQDEVKKLKDVTGRIQVDVTMAVDNGMEVEDEVSEWLEKVQTTLTTMEEEVKKLLEDKENLCCLDICSRHRLGREGKKKMMVVTGLKDEGNFERVAHAARLTDIWCTSSTSYEHFESRKSVFKEIMEALKDDSVYKIGIYGMPGVGKTSIVEQVGKQAGKDLFDEVAMAVFSQIPDLNKIQEKLADCLNLELKKKSEEGRAGELCNRLKNGRKILVILDDVWGNQITLKKIGIPDVDDTKGCKILLTSRRLEVCKQMGFEKNLEIGLLSKPEAWQLFKRTVGDFIEADREMLSVAGKVCGECDCLPLAILAIGAALKDEKEKHAWDDALEQLRNSHGHKIEGVTEKLYSHIEWSYNYLKQTDVQSCFLHCCLFPEDAEISIDTLVMYGVGTKFLESTDRTSMKKAQDRTRVLVGILKKSYLLFEGKNENFVKMHDVIRDVAMSIASKEPNRFLVNDNVRVWPEKDDYKSCRAISLRASHNVCPPLDMFECPELRTLALRCSSTTGGSQLELPDSFLKKMEHLQVLSLFKMKLLPSSLSNLIKLRMLCLFHCSLENLSFLKEFKNLEMLTIYGIYGGVEMVLEIRQLTHLRLLDLRHCNIILPSGILACLSGLEELYTSREYCKWDVEGNASIVELNSLTTLNSLEIHIAKDVISLTTNLPNFRSLKAYKIGIGYDESYRQLPSETKILGLKGIPLMVELDILMANAEVLYLIELEGIKKKFHDRDGKWFLDLKYLQVRRCNDMEHLLSKPKWSSQAHGPWPPGCFGKLSILEVSNCRLMKYLFSSSIASGLPKLQNLIIKNCESLEEIVGGDEEIMDKVNFLHLKEMLLECLPNLISIYTNKKKTTTRECNPYTNEQALFNEKVAFPKLEKLYIKRLKSVRAIWDKKLLPILEARNSFEHLQELKVAECETMEEIVAFGVEEEANDETVVFPQLKTMHLTLLPNFKIFSCSYGSKKAETSSVDIPQLQALFNHKVTFPILEKLYIKGLNSVRAIWDKLLLPVLEARNSFEHLQELKIAECEKMEEIVVFGVEEEANDETVLFPQLKTMDLNLLPNLKIFNCSYGSKKAKTSAVDILELQALFNHKKLYINELNSVRAIWDKQLLPILEAGNSFEHLQELKVRRCEKMEEIVAFKAEKEANEETVPFPQLKTMDLTLLPNLKIFSCSCSSKKVETSSMDIPKLQALFNHKVTFPILEKLYIKGLNNVRAIWDKQLLPVLEARNSFEHLQELKVAECEKMKVIVAFGVEEESNDETVQFPQLKTMDLAFLPNLKSFSYSCGSKKVETSSVDIFQRQALFNHKVTFPILEKLYIKGLNSVRAIWEKLKLPVLEARNSFEHLQELKVAKCEKMEEIVAFGVEEEANDETVLFPQLKIMDLTLLPNLKIFNCSYGSKKVETSTVDIPELQALFNHKVMFPILEKLYINELNSVRAIWDKQLLPILEAGNSFEHLQELKVAKCEKMEEIVAFGVKKESNDETVQLPQLKTMDLTLLPNLKSFSCNCGSKKAETSSVDISQLQALFNHKVMFPILEKLYIKGLNSVRAIWDKQLLPVLEARNSFEHLQEFKVAECAKMEEIVAFGEEEEAKDKIVLFPQLKTMDLTMLSNLKIFNCSCGSKNAETSSVDIPQLQVLFNHKVMFPILEKLYIKGLNNVRAIWDKQLLPVLETRNSFEHLQELKVAECEKMEEIVAFGVEEESNDETVQFPQLKTMDLTFLPNLKSFSYSCGSKKAETSFVDIFQLQALFNHKIMFPILEKLYIKKLNSVRAIWDKQLLPVLEARNFIEHLQELEVAKCEKMEEIVAFGAEEEANDEIVLFPQLKIMNLTLLPNLKCFSYSCGSRKAETSSVDNPQLQPLFNHKVKFLSLEKLYIHKIDNLKEIWGRTVPTDSVCKLRTLGVNKCHKLVNIVPSRLLGSFQNLESLCVNDCNSLEEVFIAEESDATAEISGRDKVVGKEEKNNLAFCQLRNVLLIDLPCLTSFYRRSRIFEFPALVRVGITNCPMLEVLLLRYQETAKRKTIDGHLQALTNEKAVFPTLEELELSDWSVLEHIRHDHISRSCFSKVRVLRVNYCSKPVDCCTLPQRFEAVKKLIVSYCSSSQVGFFNNEELNVIGRRGFQVFNNLTTLYVYRCNSVRYLFSVSIAIGLMQLENLRIWSCGEMEGIVRNEDGRDEIIFVFPRLRFLELKYLQSLTSFCGPNIIAFRLPSLNHIVVQRCPEFWTISGGTSKPGPSLFGDRLDTSLKEALNNFQKQSNPGHGHFFWSRPTDNDDKVRRRQKTKK